MPLNFDDKLEIFSKQLIKRLQPTIIDTKYLRHYICDFIELFVFFSEDFVTKSDLRSLFDANNFNLASVNRDYVGGLSKAEEDDNKEEELNYLFRCLGHREYLASNAYPFVIDGNKIQLKEELSCSAKIYLIFLFASHLNVFTEFSSDLTSEFEHLTYRIAQKMFTDNFEIKQFGKNSEYGGCAREKIRQLAIDMNIEVDSEALNQIPLSNQQERGLDLIAWMPFKDGIASNMLVYLFQCACGKKWHQKFSEVFRYLDFFEFKGLKPTGVMAISYGLNIIDEFEQRDDVVSSKSLVLDRFRLIEFINNAMCSEIEQGDLVSISLVDELIKKELYINQ